LEIIEKTAYFDQPRLLKRFLLYSAALHVLFFVYLSVKSVLFPSVPKEYISALRVDLVALPDQKKNTVMDPPKPVETKPVDAPKPTEVEKPKVKPEEDANDYSIAKKKKAEHQKKEKEAQKKLKQALDRIKALERVKALAAGTEVKGNQISKGTSLSSEAKTSLEASYSDVVLERVRSNWELPKWLTEKGFSADVIIFIDPRGAIKGMKFTKPSGNAQFDNEVRRTLEASTPFSIPPEGITSDLSQDGIALAFPL
jgi:outer membrane biosynthesis protein TonB